MNESTKEDTALKQPWLKKEEIFQGKPRTVSIGLINEENESKKFLLDRRHLEHSSFSPQLESDEEKDERFKD